MRGYLKLFLDAIYFVLLSISISVDGFSDTNLTIEYDMEPNIAIIHNTHLNTNPVIFSGSVFLSSTISSMFFS